MIKTANELSSEMFKKMLSGKKTYLPKAVSKELKSAGLGKLLNSDSIINKRQALKALEHLEKKGMLPSSKQPNKILKTATIQQYELNEEERIAERDKHVRANIMMDISDEMAEQKDGKDSIRYDPRSALGKRVIDDLDKERDARDKKIKDEKERKNQSENPKRLKPKKIDLAENLPDMPID